MSELVSRPCARRCNVGALPRTDLVEHRRTGRKCAASLVIGIALVMLIGAGPLGAEQPAGALSVSAARQVQALQAEKATRTPAQLKMDSQLVYAVKLQRKDPAIAAVPTLRVGVDVTTAGMTLVDITTIPKADLTAFIRSIGGTVKNRLDRSMRALVPVTRLEEIAARPDVRWVMPAAKYMLNKNTTTEGDTTHRVARARALSGFTGAGIKVGVLSDSDDFLATLQGTGDLPSTILSTDPGPGVTTVHSGSPGTGEGTGMMEIVYDLVPNVHLFFSTGDGGLPTMANNIRELRTTYGCDVIVDDLTYFVESPFHLGDTGGVSPNHAADIIQAVNDVVAAGAMYFSSAANDQNKDQGFSGTWEGDWADGGAAAAPLPNGSGQRVLNFGGGQTYDLVTEQGCGSGHSCVYLDLWWADPLAGSSNDYDLYLLDNTGASVISSSTNTQSGTQDPEEHMFLDLGASPPTPPLRIVVLQNSGAAARFLHLGTNRSQLSINTSGATRGHNALGGMSVAATPAGAAFPNPFNGTDVTETYSSDGFRRVFFGTDGTTAITPGNFSSTGGSLLNKPDFTAADCVTSSWPGVPTFCGTSAAAPHAAGIAALLKQGGYSNASILAAMKSTSIDIMAAGIDRDSGTGIVMADATLLALDPCTFTCPSNITGPNDPNQCGATVNFLLPVGSGACGTITANPPSGSFFPIGTTTVHVSSDAGTTCSFTVTVNDTQHPTITCPPDMTVQFTDGTGATVTWPGALAADNCPGVTVSYNPPNGSHFTTGTTPVTATATDASGNQTTCTFSVTVIPPIPTMSRGMLVGLAGLLLLVGLFVLLRLRQGN